MIVRARHVEPSDWPEIRAILGDLADELRDHRGGGLHLAERNPLPSSGPAVSFVGLIDDVVVGVALVREVAVDGASIGDVHAFGVLPAARGVGVGAAMFEQVLRACASQGWVGVDVSALPGARETKNFFESHGFTARRLVLHRPFDTDR